MNMRFAIKCAVVCAVEVLLLGLSASAQTTSIVKVSDAIEGNFNLAAVTAARCGRNIVVGFGDTEPNSPNGLGGYAVSQDNGVSFKDLGTIPVYTFNNGYGGPDAGGVFQLTCVNSSLFYAAALYADNGNGVPGGGNCFFPICAAISLSVSTNGGTTWSLPKVIASASRDIHDFIAGSMAVDPANTQRLYVAYLNQNASPPADGEFNCPDADIYELRMASSMDGGMTWADNLVDFACGQDTTPNPDHNGTLASPDVTVSPDSKVYVTYQFTPQFGDPSLPREIRFAQSADHGVTFSAPVKVSTALNNANPKLAVNRTFSPHRGNVYVTWTGSPSGTHTDVLVSESLNGGLSFSFPRPINAAPTTGPGRTQATPVIAVDEDGQVQDCFYNTGTSTPSSSSIYSYNCATSFNYTATWQLQQIVNSAPPASDALAVDFLRHHDGFFTAFEVQASGQTHVAGKQSDLN